MKRVLFVIIILGLTCSGCTLFTGKDAAFVRKDNELIRAFVPAAVYAIQKVPYEEGGYSEEEVKKLLLYADEIMKNRGAWDSKLGLNEE